MRWTGALPYFSARELASPDDGSIILDARFAAALPELRRRWGRPLFPTSVCRTPEHNLEVGGHPRSLHLTHNPVHPTHGTMAIDIRWECWREHDCLRFSRLAYKLGWSIGLHPTFVHMDLRTAIDLRQMVFVYDDWDGFARSEVF